MQTFSWSFSVAETADGSILASIAAPFSYLLVPVIGVVSWQMAAAAITGFIAKENVVGTLAVCFVGLDNLIDAEELSLMEGAGAEVASVFAITKAAALAYLVFNLFTPPCFAAIGAIKREMNNFKWTFFAIGYQTLFAYLVSLCVYQFGTLIMTGTFNIFTAVAILVVIFGLLLLFRRGKKIK